MCYNTNNKKSKNEFDSSKQAQLQKFVFIDVGGSRFARKHWMRMMKDDLNAVIFVVANFDLGFMKQHTLHEAMNMFGDAIDAGFLTIKQYQY